MGPECRRGIGGRCSSCQLRTSAAPHHPSAAHLLRACVEPVARLRITIHQPLLRSEDALSLILHGQQGIVDLLWVSWWWGRQLEWLAPHRCAATAC